MNNIEQIDPQCRLYYNKPAFITYGPIFTSSPKEYGQYLQNKKRKKNNYARERVKKRIWQDI